MNELRILRECEKIVMATSFVSSKFYAFSLLESNELYIGNFENDNVLKFDSENSHSVSLHYLPKSDLLLSILKDCSVVLYHTDKLPHLPVIGKLQAVRTSEYVGLVQSFLIKGKEYIVTAMEYFILKIWHLIKGKMRLFRVIRTGGLIRSLVYLENSEMIAVLYQSGKLAFFGVFSGKLEREISVKAGCVENMFLMKDKNMIGVMNPWISEIEFVQLQGKEGG